MKKENITISQEIEVDHNLYFIYMTLLDLEDKAFKFDDLKGRIIDLISFVSDKVYGNCFCDTGYDLEDEKIKLYSVYSKRKEVDEYESLF